MWIYLIGNEGLPGLFKIGRTGLKNVKIRLKLLQTGSSDLLFLQDYFYTETPVSLEQMLHLHFKLLKYLNEWFKLSDEDVKNFTRICITLLERINALKENPFFDVK